MVECVFTLDYEIYGNGRGSLEKAVREPAARLSDAFAKYRAPMVVFVEAAEMEMIEAAGSDAASGAVRTQIAGLARDGHEIGLHMHPQWYRGSLSPDGWRLDQAEYNLGSLPEERIDELVGWAVAWLERAVDLPDYAPFSFRAGNWLFQPSAVLARVLAGRGLRLDSSVFKGGLQRRLGLDYRPALANGYHWRFSDDINRPDSDGVLMEVPIHARMVPFWKMLTSRRVGLQSRMPSGEGSGGGSRLARLRDFMRPTYPQKLDFCRLEPKEFRAMIEVELSKDARKPGEARPLVAIGHTKDLTDTATVDSALRFLADRGVRVTTLRGLAGSLARCGKEA